jgi:hypothetical protein
MAIGIDDAHSEKSVMTIFRVFYHRYSAYYKWINPEKGIYRSELIDAAKRK